MSKTYNLPYEHYKKYTYVFSFVARPLFESLKRLLPETQTLLENIDINRCKFEDILTKEKEKTLEKSSSNSSHFNSTRESFSTSVGNSSLTSKYYRRIYF